MEKKKNYGLFKVISIAFLMFVILTWIIPTGSFSSGEFVKGEVTPVGLYGIFTTPVYSFAVFAQYFVIMLCIGGFYGVLNKTGVYQKIVDSITKKFGAKHNLFLIISILVFSLITSLFGEVVMVLVLLPFFITVLLKLGFDKLSCLASTIGASLIGMIASISGNLYIYRSYFQVETKNIVIFNVIMFIILVFLLITYVISKNNVKLNNKKNKSEDDKSKLEKTEVIKKDVIDIPLYENVKSNKKSIMPLVIIMVLVFLLLVLGLYNWYYSFDISLFEELYEKLTTVELFGVNIISKVFGEFPAIGSFSNYDLGAILVIASVIIAWVYSVKLSDFVDGFKNGVKVMLLPSIYIILASMIFSSVVTSSGGNISLTISNFILNLSSDFNVITGTIAGLLGSFFYNDYLYLINGLYSILMLYNTEMMPAILFVFQSMFGIMMFILPVSITLIGGLKYIEVSYKDWVKYIWKFLIQVFAICIIGTIILSMLV